MKEIGISKRLLLAAPLFTLVVACSDNDSSTPTPAPEPNTVSLSATYTKGAVEGGTCSLFAIAEDGTISTEVLATATTDSSGVADFSDIEMEDGSALISCEGGTYTDEATGATLTPPTMRAVIDTAITTTPAITPLTEIAVQKAEDDPNGILTALSEYNQDNSLGIDVTAVTPTNLQTDAAEDNDEGDYATLLAIISQVAANEEADSADELAVVIEQLANDEISDTEIAEAAQDLADSDSVAAGNISDTILDAVIDDLDLDDGTFEIGGTITNSDGLTGQWELFIDTVLIADGGLTAGAVTYSESIADGAAYELTTSNEDCSITNGSGTVNGADISGVDITCATSNTATFTISGTISNTDSLSGQWELFSGTTLLNDGGLTEGTVTYIAAIADGTDYEVLASNSDCSVTNGSGTISGANVTGVDISCVAAPSTFSIAGTISNPDGLTGQWQLSNAISTDVLGSGDLNAGLVTYNASVVDGTTYILEVDNNNCTITNDYGIVNGADVTADISCVEPTTTYSVSGTIINPDALSGQWEMDVDDVFENDGGLSAGPVTFSSAVASGSSYELTVSNPECVVIKATGTVSDADITGVTIDCSTPEDRGQVVEITDMDTGDTGELRYDLDTGLTSGAFEVSLYYDPDETQTAYVTLYDSSASLSSDIADISFLPPGDEFSNTSHAIAIRAASGRELISGATFTPGVWFDVTVTWNTTSYTLMVDDATYGPFDSQNPGAEVDRPAVRLSSNSGTSDYALLVDDFAIYSDESAVSEVFTDDYESYAVDTLLDSEGTYHNRTFSAKVIDTSPDDGGDNGGDDGVISGQVAEITDMDTGDTGELRYDLSTGLTSGAFEVSLYYDPDETQTAYVTLYDSSASLSSDITDISFLPPGDEFGNTSHAIAIRAASGRELISGATFTPGVWFDVTVTWNSTSYTLMVDDATYGPFDSQNPGAEVDRPAVRLSSNSGTSDFALLVDDFAIYSDESATTEVFSDDFESYAADTQLDTEGTYHNRTFSVKVINLSPDDGGDDGDLGSQVAVITDTDENDTGELRYKFDSGLREGKFAVSVLYQEGETETAYIALWDTTTKTGSTIMDLKFDEGSFELRNQDDFDFPDGSEFTPGQWIDFEVSWDSTSDTDLPTYTLSIDGVSYGTFTAGNQIAGVEVTHASVRISSNSGTSSTELYVDDFNVYSDQAGTVSVFSDDFEGYALGTDLDASPYNSSTFSVVVGEVASGGDDGGDNGGDDGGDNGGDDGGDNGGDDGGDNGGDDGGDNGGDDGNKVGWGSDDSVPTVNCTTVVSTLSALEDAAEGLTAGETLCLADGTYTDRLELDITGVGTLDNPITVAAQNPGSAIVSGESSIQMSGEYVVFQGFVFHGGETRNSDLIQTRTSSTEFCNYCRITEISIVDIDYGNFEDSGKWMNLYGQHNRIDHNWFAGKAERSVMLSINREAPDAGAEFTEIDYFQIDHNYFGDRAPTDGKAYADSSDNDYEAIRTGTSDSHAYDSFTVIENNYFERIDGEAEVISNKAGNNTIRNNTVRDSYGSITTRHGSSATIENNFMIGDGHPYAAGLRIIDDGHRVVNNYIEGVRYLSTLFHGGIVLHDSDGSTTNGYQQADNILIAHNTVVNSVNSLNFHGGREDSEATNLYFVNNIVDNAIGELIVNTEDGLPTSATYAGNYVEANVFSDDDNLTSASGFTMIDPELAIASDGLYRPDSTSSVDLSAAIVNIGTFDDVLVDMDGQSRSGMTISGADEDSTETATTGPLSRNDVGPISYTPPESVGYVVRYPVANFDFENGETDWTITQSALISSQSDEAFSGSTAKIDDASGRIAQTIAIEADKNYTLSAFAKGPIELGVDLGGTESGSTANNSDYKFASHSFNSGSNTSVTIYAEMADEITNYVDIADGDFTDFNGSTNDDWTAIEGDGIGDVQGSSNSASGDDGSVKFIWSSNSGGSPAITQVLTNIEQNADFSLSAYILDKADTGVTVTVGVYEGETTNILASQEFDYATLEANGANEGDDSFLEGTLNFNSGSNSTLTLFVIYNENSSGGAEIRVDDISLSYFGAPAVGSEAFVDELRLVSHPNLAD